MIHSRCKYDVYKKNISKLTCGKIIRNSTTYEGSVKYTYNAFDLIGNIKTVTDWDGNVTKYTYDKLYRETKAEYSTGGRTEKNYDNIGNLKSLKEYGKDGKLASLTEYTYDSGNRLLKEVYKIYNGQYVYGYTDKFTYDDLNRVLTRVRNDIGNNSIIANEKFDYDDACNITASI